MQEEGRSLEKAKEAREVDLLVGTLSRSHASFSWKVNAPEVTTADSVTKSLLRLEQTKVEEKARKD